MVQIYPPGVYYLSPFLIRSAALDLAKAFVCYPRKNCRQNIRNDIWRVMRYPLEAARRVKVKLPRFNPARVV